MKSPARRSLLAAAAFAVTLSAFATPGFVEPATPAPRLLLLGIDRHAFPLRENVTLYLTKPDVRAEPVLTPSTDPNAPDNAATHLYGSVIKEGDRFRMWYYAVCYTSSEAALAINPVAYAESSDGIHWERPKLGQVEWKGSRDNNLIALGDEPEEGCEGVSVLRDDDDPDPARRYKMIYGRQLPKAELARLGVKHRWIVRTAVSADGLHWHELPNYVSGENFAEFASLYKHDGLYIVNSHMRSRGEGDRPEGRQGYAWVSTDFEHWLPESAPSFKTPEPVDGSGWGTHGATGGAYTQVHLGVGAKSLGNVAVGFYGMWHQQQPSWGEGGTYADLGLLISQDGLHFEEVVKALPFLRSVDSPADPVPGRHYPTILCQNNSILNVGDETWIYHGRWRNVEFQQLGTGQNDGINIAKNYWGGVGLARIPRDRWGALALWHDETAGSVWTMPVTLAPGATLALNGADLKGVRLEVADAAFHPLAGYESGAAAGDDSLSSAVAWDGHALGDLAGRTVRFHLHFDRTAAPNPRVYALYLQTTP